jgi:hypothetical protein
VADPRARFKDDRFSYVENSRAEYLFARLTERGVARPNLVNGLGKKNGVDYSDPNVMRRSVVAAYTAAHPRSGTAPGRISSSG